MMIWFVIFLYFSLVNCHNTNSSDDKLIYTQIIFRHGDRNILQSYANDPHQDKSHWPEGLGQLTKEGKQREYLLGQFFRRRYEDFIGFYVPDKVSILSSDFDRTINSAYLVLAGFFPPKYHQIWNEYLFWQPIAVHTILLEKDVYLDNESACPRYLKCRQEYDQSAEMLALVESNQELFNYMEMHAGQPVRTIEHLKEVYEVLELEYYLNKTLPEWTRAIFFPGSTAEYLRMYWIQFITGTPEMKRLKSGFLLKEILDRFHNKTTSLLPESMMHIYSAHDLTIASLLNTLGIFELHLPPYASSLMFELYETDRSTHYIQLFYKNTTAENLSPLDIPNCGTKCSLKKFYELYDDVLASDIDTECAVESNDEPSSGNVVKTTPTLQHFTIFIFILYSVRKMN